MRVRMPGGELVEYAEANYASRKESYTDLYTANPDKGGKWLAQVPNTLMIEVRTPTRVTPHGVGLEQAVAIVLGAVEQRDSSLDRHQLKDLKTALQDFDARRREWKG